MGADLERKGTSRDLTRDFDIPQNRTTVRRRLNRQGHAGKIYYVTNFQDRAKQERMDYLEFIARVTSHIPDEGQVMIRYIGLYANAHRGKVRKSEEGRHKPLIIEEACPKIPRRLMSPIRNF
jgi:hypothetical protein